MLIIRIEDNDKDDALMMTTDDEDAFMRTMMMKNMIMTMMTKTMMTMH